MIHCICNDIDCKHNITQFYSYSITILLTLSMNILHCTDVVTLFVCLFKNS